MECHVFPSNLLSQNETEVSLEDRGGRSSWTGRETHREFPKFKQFSLLHLCLESALWQWLKPDKTSDTSSNKKLSFFARRSHLFA